MFQEFSDTIKDVKIIHFETEITQSKKVEAINLIYFYKTIILSTENEFNSKSWIESGNNFDDLIGKNIECIKEIKCEKNENIPYSKHRFYEIKFRNSDEIFNFRVTNVSKYDENSWLRINELNKIKKHHDKK